LASIACHFGTLVPSMPRIWQAWIRLVNTSLQTAMSMVALINAAPDSPIPGPASPTAGPNAPALLGVFSGETDGAKM
jgi:hypothetical protein